MLPPTSSHFKVQWIPHLDNLARRGERVRKGYIWSWEDDSHALEKRLGWKIPQTSPSHRFRTQRAYPPTKAHCQISKAKTNQQINTAAGGILNTQDWHQRLPKVLSKSVFSTKHCLQGRASWNWNDSHLSTPSTFPVHTSLAIAFWRSSDFNSPESITCPCWGRKVSWFEPSR